MFTAPLNLLRSFARPVLSAAYHSGLYRMASPVYAGCGVIFSLHRVVEPGYPVLHPGYMIQSDQLDLILKEVREQGWEIITIDQVRGRLGSVDSWQRRFACFTCDDGYSDNLTHALPVFRKHLAPLCVYIATGMIERSATYWTGPNQELVLKSDRLELPAGAGSMGRILPTRTFEEKKTAYRVLDELCHSGGEDFLQVQKLYLQHGVDPLCCLDRDALTLEQARELAEDPLVTIGAHSVTHQRLSRMTERMAMRELADSRRILEQQLSVEVCHVSYPFGRGDACGSREFALAKKLHFRTGVTTRQGNIFPGHRDHLHCLPRRTVPLSRWKARNVLFGVETLLHFDPKFQTV